jgi:hypothetical protein
MKKNFLDTCREEVYKLYLVCLLLETTRDKSTLHLVVRLSTRERRDTMPAKKAAKKAPAKKAAKKAPAKKAAKKK